jgi:hypothetical protein
VLIERSRTEEVCEAFFEPEIVPPDHRGQVPKPHMRQLVQVDVVVHCFLYVVLLVFWQQGPVSKSDRAHILHSADPEFRAVDYIVLREGEGVVKQSLVKLDALCENSENHVWVHIVRFTLADKDAHWSDGVFARVHNLLKFTGA